MNILAFDAAAAACSAVLCRDGTVVAREWQAMARGHAEALVPMIGTVMSGCRYQDLAAIAVTVGPGAFTGLRIALATARGLSLATGVPAIGITSFAVSARMAVAQREGANTTPLIIALETKRDDLYLQSFDVAGLELTPPASVARDELQAWLPDDIVRIAVAGDAAMRLIDMLPDGIEVSHNKAAALPDAAVVAALAFEQVKESGVPVTPLRPLYLRPPNVTAPKARERRSL